MRKIIIFVFIILISLLSQSAYAQTKKFKAEAMSDFSTKNPPDTFVAKFVGDYALDNGEVILDGTLIKGKITKITPETRGKRNAYAYMQLLYAKSPNTDKVLYLSDKNLVVKISEYEPIDFAEKTMDVGASAAGFVVKNAAYPINFIRGVINPEDENDNRLVAGAKMSYEKSVFSYVSKGKPFTLKKGDMFIITVKYNKD